MKLDIHGIRFRLWLVFMFLAVGITMFIGVLQTGLIGPYYRNSKIRAVQTVADIIQDELLGGRPTREGISSALRQTVNNNACVLILNSSGKVVYEADSIGAGCVFRSPLSSEVNHLLDPENLANTLNRESPEYSIEAILMDIRMPVMDGLTAAAKIRQLERKDAALVPIIALSANAFQEDVEDSRKAGMNDHLTKPIEPVLLLNCLQRQIGNYEAQRRGR